MSACLVSAATGNALNAAIQRDQIIAGANIEIVSRDENGTFLARTNAGGYPSSSPGQPGGPYVPRPWSEEFVLGAIP